MGRGQMMAFGRNSWRSRSFEMHVDIKGSGLDYELFERDEDHQGTLIEVSLYDPILPSDLERIKAELRNFVAWAQIPVMLNGEQISKRPEAGKWNFEDEFAYYSLSPDRQQLSIYNLGVLVNSFWAGRFGMGGVVVSKEQLEVNFARNDVQSTCLIGKAIAARIKKEAGKGISKKTQLTDAERDMMVRDFLAGEMDPGAANKLRCLTDVNGRSWPITKLEQIPGKFSGRLVVAERGDQMIETAQRRGIVFSVDASTLERFGAADGKAFLERISSGARRILDAGKRDTLDGYRLGKIADSIVGNIQVVDREALRAFVSDDYIALEDGEITPENKVILFAIERGYARMIDMLNLSKYEDRTFSPRKIRLGKSEAAMAWTDGESTIWIDVEHARLLRRGIAGAYQVALTLLHEMLHEGPDTGTHQHDFAFYQAFHDMTSLEFDALGQAADRITTAFISRLRQQKGKLSKALLAHDDADAALAQLRDELDRNDEA
jgi:hypothetical protein